MPANFIRYPDQSKEHRLLSTWARNLLFSKNVVLDEATSWKCPFNVQANDLLNSPDDFDVVAPLHDDFALKQNTTTECPERAEDNSTTKPCWANGDSYKNHRAQGLPTFLYSYWANS